MADIKPQGTQQYAVESGYESGDANVKSIVTGLSIILTSTLVVMAAMFGMFNVLNGRISDEQEKTPAALSSAIRPPEPHLLPSPYTDTVPEAAKIGQSTPDEYPWDKRNLEIENQYNEANAYARNTDGTARIPVAQAMEMMAGQGAGPGTPAAMSWQPEYPILMAGKDKADRTMNLPIGSTLTSPRTFDQRPAAWETQDEKFTVSSTGGRDLVAGDSVGLVSR